MTTWLTIARDHFSFFLLRSEKKMSKIGLKVAGRRQFIIFSHILETHQQTSSRCTIISEVSRGSRCPLPVWRPLELILTVLESVSSLSTSPTTRLWSCFSSLSSTGFSESPGTKMLAFLPLNLLFFALTHHYWFSNNFN